jgi:hypothetical protein
MRHLSSEVTTDLVQEHFSVVLEVLNAPMPAAALQARIGARALQRLIQDGVLTDEGGIVSAPANVLARRRQDSLAAHLQSWVPALAQCDLRHLHLTVAPERFWGTHGEPFLDGLGAVATGSGFVAPMELYLIGCPMVLVDPLPSVDRALAALAEASRVRTDPQRRDQAVLVRFDALVNAPAYGRALALAQQFFDALPAADPTASTCHLTVGIRWLGQLPPTECLQ